MSRESVLKALQAAAARNGGKAPGERVLQREAGITRRDLWNAGFSRYSEAVAAAGLTPNVLWTAPDASQLLEAILGLAVQKGHCPTTGELRVARAQDGTFPSSNSITTLTRARGRSLRALLLEHAQNVGRQEAVAFLESAARATSQQASAPARIKVTGYVYLVRHDRDYKIGRSNDVSRRRREVALLLPQDLEHVHIIETDDPDGIERYWHERFAARRLKGEWFRLTADDVAAFKRRKYQ